MNNFQVVPGRAGLLVTMFLSLTTLLVGSVSQSPSVAEGVNALTAWMMVHYLFIITILLVYSYQLCLIRFLHNLSMPDLIFFYFLARFHAVYEISVEENKMSKEAKSAIVDKSCLLILFLLYILFNAFYWPFCI